MRKIPLLLVFLYILSAIAFAKESKTVTLCIQGSGVIREHVAFFKEAFTAEAAGAGFKVDDKDDFKYSDYGIKFEVNPNTPFNEKQFVLVIYLIKIKDLSTIATASYLYSDLEEIAPYTQYLFFRIMVNVPGYGSGGIGGVLLETVGWRNKWMYLRMSIDYPNTVYELQSTGLIAGSGVYYGKFENPDAVVPLDNRIISLPGFTLGLEFQLLNWLSLEPNFNINMEELFGKYYFSLAGNLELKFPIKPGNFMVEPYLALSYPILYPDIFNEFPRFAFGGGAQAAVKGGTNGAFFIDINYLHTLQPSIMKNPYAYGGFMPEPKTIEWRRFSIGLGLGYKFGFINRNNPR